MHGLAARWWGSARGPAADAPRWPASASCGASAASRPAPPPDQRPIARAEPAHSKHGSRTNQNTIFDAFIASVLYECVVGWCLVILCYAH